MAIICSSCGKEIPDDIAFCTECGAKVPAEESAEVSVCKKCGKELPEGGELCAECKASETDQPEEEIAKEDANQSKTDAPPKQEFAPPPPPPPQYANPAPAEDPKTKPVSTGTFFGLEFVYKIPVIGWITCLIMAFAPKNKSLKHYARAKLIWLLIGLAFAVGTFFLVKFVGGFIVDYIGDFVENNFGEYSEVFEQFGDIGELLDKVGDLGDLADQYGGIEGIIDQYGGMDQIIDKYGSMKDFISQVGDIEGITTNSAGEYIVQSQNGASVVIPVQP